MVDLKLYILYIVSGEKRLMQFQVGQGKIFETGLVLFQNPNQIN